MSLKYYVYISDTKVDMLYGQIPKKMRENIAAELKIDLKLLSLTLKQDVSDETKYTKLDIVTNYITRFENVGTIDEPKDYFVGELPMQWGPYGRYDAVYFAGETKETVLGLGGSTKHVLGESGQAKANIFGLSNLAGIITSMAFHLIQSSEIHENISIDAFSKNRKDALYLTYWVSNGMKGPEQKLEFLSRKLLEGYYDEVDRSRTNRSSTSIMTKPRHVVLGSPLYVALTR